MLFLDGTEQDLILLALLTEVIRPKNRSHRGKKQISPGEATTRTTKPSILEVKESFFLHVEVSSVFIWIVRVVPGNNFHSIPTYSLHACEAAMRLI